jgi:hypothetical protein
MAKAKKAAVKKEIEKAHAGKPVSPTEDPADHSTSAASLAAATDPKGKTGATVNAESMDAVNKDMEAKEDADRLEEDQSIFGRARRAGIFWVNDHSRGGGPYIGISPQNDPKADTASKERSTVEPLELHVPQTGMQVRLEDGTSFGIPEGFGPGSTPADWERALKRPDGKPLFD